MEQNPEFSDWLDKFETLGFQPSVMFAPWLPFGPAAEFSATKKKVRFAIEKEIAKRKEWLSMGKDAGRDYCGQLIQHFHEAKIEYFIVFSYSRF